MTIRKFYKYNKTKLWFSFKFISLSFLIIATIILTIGYFNNQLPSTSLLIGIILIAAIGIPLLLMLLIILISILKGKFKIKIFSKLDSIKNNQIQIKDVLLNEDTNFLFTDIGREILIDNNYRLISSINDISTDIIEFTFKFSIEDHSKKQKLLAHKDKLNQDNINLSPYLDSVTKFYRIRTFKKLCKNQLEKELLSFVNKMVTQYL